MAICNDDNVRELLSVSVLEPLVMEGDIVVLLCNYLKEETMKEINYWKKRYGKM